MQFWPPDDEFVCSKHVEAWNKTYFKTILCIKLVKYRDKYRDKELYMFCTDFLFIIRSLALYTIHSNRYISRKNYYYYFFYYKVLLPGNYRLKPLVLFPTSFPLTFRGPYLVIYSCNKTNEMHWFLKFIFGIEIYMFRTVSLSIIRSLALYTQQRCMSYRLCWLLASKPSA